MSPRVPRFKLIMVNIFRRAGRLASRAGRLLKPHGPRHGAPHYLRKHGMTAALVTGGVALGTGGDVLIDALKSGEDEPPILMQGGQLAENRISDSSWNLFKIDTTNENFAE